MNEQKPVSMFSRLKSLTGNDQTAVAPSQTTDQGQGSGAVAMAVSEAKAEVKKRKGRSSTNSSGPGPASADVDAARQAELSKLQGDLDKLFAPEMWEPIVKLPALVTKTLTGHPHWDIPKEESQPLALSASTAMRYAQVTNPTILAVSLFLIQAIMVYTPRVLKEIQIRNIEKQKQNQDAKPQ